MKTHLLSACLALASTLCFSQTAPVGLQVDLNEDKVLISSET